MRLFEHLKTAGFHFKTEIVDQELIDKMDETNDITQLPQFSSIRKTVIIL
jgi:hypothetical protein